MAASTSPADLGNLVSGGRERNCTGVAVSSGHECSLIAVALAAGLPFAAACPGLSIVNVAELPDVERFESTHSLGPYNQWSAAHASFRLLSHMYSSFRQNPEWGARQQEIGQRLANGAMARWRGEQRHAQQMDDAITNTAHFVGPGGQHYDLDASPHYQWLTPNGQTIGTDTPTPPFPGCQLLQRLPE